MYREPMPLQAGELPADLLARVVERPQSDPTFGEALVHGAENSNESAEFVVAQARVELATPAFSVRCSTN